MPKLLLLFIFAGSLSLLACAGAEKAELTRASAAGACRPGETRTGFLLSSIEGDIPCPSGTQVCVEGSSRGPHLFDSCKEL